MTSFAVTRSGTDVHGWYAIEVDGKILVDAGLIPVGSLNSSFYNQDQVWSNFYQETQCRVVVILAVLQMRLAALFGVCQMRLAVAIQMITLEAALPLRLLQAH